MLAELHRAVADEHLLRRDAVARGERLDQLDRAVVGIPVGADDRGGRRLDRRGQRAERRLVRRQLHRLGELVLGRDRLRRLPGHVPSGCRRAPGGCGSLARRRDTVRHEQREHGLDRVGDADVTAGQDELGGERRLVRDRRRR